MRRNEFPEKISDCKNVFVRCNEFPERFEANQYYKNGFIGSIINNFFRHY